MNTKDLDTLSNKYNRFIELVRKSKLDESESQELTDIGADFMVAMQDLLNLAKAGFVSKLETLALMEKSSPDKIGYYFAKRYDKFVPIEVEENEEGEKYVVMLGTDEGFAIDEFDSYIGPVRF